jgi:hypothetical protein
MIDAQIISYFCVLFRAYERAQTHIDTTRGDKSETL